MIFLTSTMGEDYWADGSFRPKVISNDNNWRNMLKTAIPPMSYGILVAASPDDFENNNNMCRNMIDAFAMSGIEIEDIRLCDRRTCGQLPDMLKKAGFVILSGGHLPTQNRFFAEINLKELLKNFGGTIIGISAGTMNSADIVYSAPELEGEAIDPEFKRYLTGLGLTDINVFPHFQVNKDSMLDGMKMIDILKQDSYTRPFVALNDGSYIAIDGGDVTLYGDAFYFINGEIEQICYKEKMIRLDGYRI